MCFVVAACVVCAKIVFKAIENIFAYAWKGYVGFVLAETAKVI